MTPLLPQGEGIPVPQPTIVSRPFWEGCARGELLFQRCKTCQRAVFIPALMCRYCTGAALAWERSVGLGMVYGWTVVWRPQTPVCTVPYAPAIVQVDEGFQILTNIIGCVPEDLRVSLPVRVDLHLIGGGIQLPYFRAVDGGAA